MPIHCHIAFPRLTEAEMRELDYEVMRYAFATHQTLGCLCDESVYQAHLAHLVSTSGSPTEREVPVTLAFRDFEKPLYLDLVVAGRVIYELKTAASLTAAHTSQLLNYLFLTNSARGKLVNFRPSSVESRFVNSAIADRVRRNFQFSAGDWRGSSGFRDLVEELVTDWGTGLEQSLYTQAVIHCLGGEETVARQVPMQLEGVSLGQQRFHLVNASTAFRLTTFQDGLEARHQSQMRKFMAPSPLKTLYWVNIARHQITLQSITR